jgi:hypothetical protein
MSSSLVKQKWMEQSMYDPSGEALPFYKKYNKERDKWNYVDLSIR